MYFVLDRLCRLILVICKLIRPPSENVGKGFGYYLRGVQNFVFPRCARVGEGGDSDGDDEGPRLVVDGGMLEEVEHF